MKQVQVVNLGTTEFGNCWEFQQFIFNLRMENKIPDILLLTEHQHVYTLGKTGEDAHLLADDTELKSSGADVYHIDRGGDITYHGPGQLVGYPILNLNNYYLDIHRYLRDLEEVIIKLLADFNIVANREKDYTGVWVGGEKIAAIGVKVSRWITMHGFALNVNTDLSYFGRIIPCGIFHKGVTSMEKVLGNAVNLNDVFNSVTKHFATIFGVESEIESNEAFLASINLIRNSKIKCQQFTK